MANAFLVQLPESAGQTLINGKNAVVVWATDAANALVLAQALSGYDSNSAWAAATTTDLSAAPVDLEGWVFDITLSGAATQSVSYTALAGDEIDDVGAALVLLLNAESDLEGYVFSLSITGIEGEPYEYTALAGDTIDDVGDGLVALLNAGADLTDYVFTLTVPTAAGSPFIITGVAGENLDEVMARMVIALNASVTIDGAAYSTTTKLLTVAAIADGLGDQNITYTVADPVAGDASALFVGAITESGIAAAVLSAQMLNDSFIFNASYDAATQILTLSDAKDNNGDATVTFTCVDDLAVDASAALISTITDGGAATAALTVQLINDGFIFGAGYVAGTNVLTVASVLDGIGDATLTGTVTLPADTDGYGVDVDDALMFTSITHEGIAGAVLKTTLVSAPHTLFGSFKA